jgi:hypothetical protein
MLENDQCNHYLLYYIIYNLKFNLIKPKRKEEIE